MKEFDVTIVGLGPAGGTLANLLAMHDFSILILDREKSFYPLPRAVHFDDEIMRIFQTIGITNNFLKLSPTVGAAAQSGLAYPQGPFSPTSIHLTHLSTSLARLARYRLI